MLSFRALWLATCVALSAPAAGLAQNTAPAGACVLPTNHWCIPNVRSLIGETCSCLTRDGWQTGIQT